MEAHPLTDNQKNILFLEQTYPGTSMHHLVMETWADTPIQFEWLDAAIHHVVRHHAGVRLHLSRDRYGVRQYIGKFRRIRIPLYDVSDLPDHVGNAALRRYVQEFATQPFALFEHDLFRFAFLKKSATRYGFLMAVHHIAFDGWSASRFFNLIWEAYEQIASGLLPVIQRDEVEPFAFVEREKKYLHSNRFVQDEHFWRKQIRTFTSNALEVPTSGQIAGARMTRDLTVRDSDKIATYIQQRGISANELFLAAVYLASSRCFNKSQIVFGVPLFGRAGKEKKAMGFYMNTVPVLIGEPDETTLDQLVEKVRTRLRSSYKHYPYPTNRLLHLFNNEQDVRNGGTRKLFQIVVNYYNMVPATGTRQFSFENHFIYAGEQIYPLQLVLKQWKEDRFTIDADYQTGVFEPGQIHQLLVLLTRALRQIIQYPTKRIGEVELLDERIKRKLRDQYNETATSFPLDVFVTEHLAQIVRTWPDQIAIADSEHRLTYKEFADRTDQIAQLLLSRGVGPNKIVAVHIDKSAAVFIAFWAILKAGGAFLPIDTSYPPERIRYILEQSRADMLLVNGKPPPALPESFKPGSIIDISSLDVTELQKRTDKTIPERAAQPEDLAYVIYTSGTTGNPKGVAITRRGLTNLHGFLQRYFALGPDDGVLQFASVSFDASIWEMTMALLSGATLHIPTQDTIHHYRMMEAFIRERRITVATLPPAYLARLQPEAMPGLKTVISAGSAAQPSTLKKWAERVQCYNAYGPTETTVCATIWKVEPNKIGKTVPIGRPIDNTQVYVLDRNLRLMPPGFPGELYIGGQGLAHGYLRHESLTRKAFIDHPFAPGQRLYRTGDLARWREDGELEFVGRADGQIQLRGYRIEPEEIEAALMRHEHIQEAAVKVVRWNEIDHLCAYFTSTRELTAPEIRAFLQPHLPQYMIPSLFMRLGELPLNHNGKPSKDKLPPYQTSQEAITGTEDTDDEALSLVKEVWADILHLKPEQIKADDHFFDLGGNSVLLMDLQYKLEQTANVRIPVAELFSFPTAGLLAEHIAFSQQANSQQSKQKDAPLHLYGQPVAATCLTGKSQADVDHLPFEFFEYTVSEKLNEKIRNFTRLVPVQELLFTAFILSLYREQDVTVYRWHSNNELRLFCFNPESFDGLEQMAAHVAETCSRVREGFHALMVRNNKPFLNEQGAIIPLFTEQRELDDLIRDCADLIFQVCDEGDHIRLRMYGSGVITRSFVRNTLHKIVTVLLYIE